MVPLDDLGVDKEKSGCFMLSTLSRAVMSEGGSFRSVISSCLHCEQMTQIYCTHPQELWPKLILVLKSCVLFACGEVLKRVGGGEGGRWERKEGAEARACAFPCGSGDFHILLLLPFFFLSLLLSSSSSFSLPSLCLPSTPPPLLSHFTSSFQ